MHRLASLLAAAFHAAAEDGELTMWTEHPEQENPACEFAGNAFPIQITDPILPSYIRNGFQCAIGDEFGNGEWCGKCFRVTSHGGTDPGRPGTATVMITNSGSGGRNHFDCVMDGFHAITGARTGIFQMDYERVPCDEVTGGLVVVNWAEKNEYYCKMMFENVGGWGGVKSVEACLDGGNCAQMQRAGGATWTNCPQHTAGSISFKIVQDSPNGDETFECNCPGSWPWEKGARCDCGGNFHGGDDGTTPTSENQEWLFANAAFENDGVVV